MTRSDTVCDMSKVVYASSEVSFCVVCCPLELNTTLSRLWPFANILLTHYYFFKT